MKNLDVNEINVAKDVVNKGLLKAAESLSFFIKEDVGIKELDFSVNTALSTPTKSGTNINLLTTEVKGELPGVCYLIFSEEEANKLKDIALPAEIKNNPELFAQMSDAIMLEVDNIISASVITEFANNLKTKIYGNVPNLNIIDCNDIENFINENKSNDTYIINFKTQFSCANTNFSPEFLWLFDNKFLERIKEVSKKLHPDGVLD